MIGTIATLLGLAVPVAGYFWVRAKWRAWKITRAESARLKAKSAAKTRRPVAQVVLSLLPVAVSQRLFRWRSPVRSRSFTAPVALARRGVLGRREKVTLTSHILIAGQTGSGKSSTQRVIAAHVLQAPNACLEVWDMKRISALRDYKGRARVCTSADEVSERLDDLVGREFIDRTDRLIAGEDVPYLVILIDEAATLLRSLAQYAVRDLYAAIEMGRELRVFFVLAVQHPLALTIPTQIRSQLSCVIAHRLKSAKESEVVFPGLVSAGWAPHLLGGPGTCLIWTHDAQPRPAYGRWLAPERFADVWVSGPVSVLTQPVSLAKPQTPAHAVRPSGVRPSIRQETPGQARGRTRADGRLSPRQAQALAALDLGGPMGAAALARELGIKRNRAHDVLRQLATRDLVHELGEGTYELTTAAARETER
ncbi:DUF87 domain-containing protein [Streptomyces sp. NPDC051665]|uniref:helicase HerA domain-containing protein n=1 Tax=Streptomyces sp. NPDC051665 TaxID=3154647 RepID=UPI0034254485